MTVAPTSSIAAEQMAGACARFLESLSPDQRERTTYSYEDGERVFWYYPPLNRHGLPLRDMEPNQQALANAIIASALTDDAYEKAGQITDLETVLGPLEAERGEVTWDRDPGLYYFTVFGEPGGEAPWGWKAEGHHLSLNFSVWGDQIISTTPFFFGSNPAEVRTGPKAGRRILARSEDLALELMSDLDASQRSKATIYDEAPRDIVTYNATRVSLPQEEGLPVSKMNGAQREMLMALVTEYVGRLRSEVAEQKLQAVTESGLDRLYWAWGGPVDRAEKHYYRIHGGSFLVEFDNWQNDANHIHSVWRDVENDFATDVLREHLVGYHII